MKSKFGMFFRYACRLVKYFSFFTVGLALATVICFVFGVGNFAGSMLSVIMPLWGRMALLVTVAMGWAVFLEAIR